MSRPILFNGIWHPTKKAPNRQSPIQLSTYTYVTKLWIVSSKFFNPCATGAPSMWMLWAEKNDDRLTHTLMLALYI